MARALMIVFDSLRKDVFDRCRHPLLERWRQKGVSFENCHSQSGFTPISFSSILAGRFPSANDVRAEHPVRFVQGPQNRSQAPVWWSVDEESCGHLILPGSRPLKRSAFTLFNRRLLTLRHSKTNAFPELSEDEMFPTPEWGQDLSGFYRLFHDVGASDDVLMVVRIYDTHLPYGRGISPLDAGSALEIKRNLAVLFARDHGRALLDEIAVPALCRALDYISDIWNWIEPLLDFAAVMSDHGDQWSDDPEQVGHAGFLVDSVLRVPLIVIDGVHRGRCWAPCNNADVMPTLLARVNKISDWSMQGKALTLEREQVSRFATEANSSRGEFLRMSMDVREIALQQ